jgi:hypothetical protein
MEVAAFTERGGDGDRERWLPVVWVRCGCKRSDERGDVVVEDVPERLNGGGVPERLKGRAGDGERRDSGREVRGEGAAWVRVVEPAETLADVVEPAELLADEGVEEGVEGVEGWRGAGRRSGSREWRLSVGR